MNIYCASPSSQFLSYKNEIESEVLSVLRGSTYILGEKVKLFEKEFAKYIGTKYSVGVGNGTDAITLALMSCGVGECDEVITVSHTAVATVTAIQRSNATPVLVDVNLNTFTIDVDLVEAAITKRTKAVVAVHLYGQGPELDKLIDICERYSIILIEDVSQAHGAKFSSRRLGSIGHIGCFSCYPTKNLGAIGDAGVITTNSESIYERLNMLREYGWKDRFYSLIPGINSRLDEIQASILLVKLKHLDSDNQRRQEIAGIYTELLRKLPIDTPVVADNCTHVYHQYVIKVLDRDYLVEHLNSKGIYPGIHYKYPVHAQPAYRSLTRENLSLTNTENLSSKILSLPIYPELSNQDIYRVCSEISSYYLQNQ